MTNPTSDPTAIRPCPLLERHPVPIYDWEVAHDCPNRRAPKQAEGVEGVVHPEWVMTTEGPRAVTVVELPLSMIGKRVMVSLLDEEDGGTKGA